MRHIDKLLNGAGLNGLAVVPRGNAVANSARQMTFNTVTLANSNERSLLLLAVGATAQESYNTIDSVSVSITNFYFTAPLTPLISESKLSGNNYDVYAGIYAIEIPPITSGVFTVTLVSSDILYSTWISAISVISKRNINLNLLAGEVFTASIEGDTLAFSNTPVGAYGFAATAFAASAPSGIVTWGGSGVEITETYDIEALSANEHFSTAYFRSVTKSPQCSATSSYTESGQVTVGVIIR